MALSNDLISQLVKVNKEPKKISETTSYGTAVMYQGKTYVKLDGSDLLTPVATASSVKDGDRVTVLIKNHSATITGNTSDPAASSFVVKEQGSQISEFEVIIAYKITAHDLEVINASIESLRATTAKIENLEVINAEIDNLEARLINVDHLTATDIEAVNAQIEHLEATFGEFKDLSTEDLEAINAEIGRLKAYTADFTYVSAEVLDAMKANIKTLDTEKLSAKEAEIKYANIDFANIGEAAMEYFYANSGLIRDVVIDNGSITGNLVGVTIKGDIIEGNTVVADKLVIKGTDGLYYKLNTDGMKIEAQQTDYNSLNGSIITAKSITATKVNVSDLVAFDATIGGFQITENSIYSGVKGSIDNTTRGIYLDNTGQVAFGDSSNVIKYYKDENNAYKLIISADSMTLGASKSNVEEALSSQNNRVALAEATIQLLSDSISMLVTDNNGSSLMTQNGGKWTFNMGSYESTLAQVSNNLNALSADVGDAKNTVNILNQAVSDLGALSEYVIITTWNGQPCVELGERDSLFKLRITNTEIQFAYGSDNLAYLTNQKLNIEKAEIKNELQFGDFIWKIRSNGNLGLTWNGS